MVVGVSKGPNGKINNINVNLTEFYNGETPDNKKTYSICLESLLKVIAELTGINFVVYSLDGDTFAVLTKE